MKRFLIFCITLALLLTSLSYAAPFEPMTDSQIKEMGGVKSTATGKYCIDYPDATTMNTFSDQIYIQGWIVDKNNNASVDIWFDNRTQTYAAELYDRPDVAGALPGYPTGSEGFRFSIPAKHFPVGTHTLHMRYTSGNGTTYSMVDTAFTVKAKAEHAFAVKTSGHKYYVYDQGYTWAEVQAFAEKEKLSPADGSVLGKSLTREAENGEATQKFTFVPQKPLRERTATVKSAGQLRYGAADAFPVMTALAEGTEVTLLGEKYEIDGLRWCYVKAGTPCGFIRTDSLSIPIESLDDIPWVTGWKATTYGYNGDDNGLCAWSGCAWGNGSPSYRVIDGCHVAVPSYCVKGTAEAYANYPELAGGYGTILEVRNPLNGATCYAIVADFGNFGVGNKYNQTAALDLPPNTCAALGLGQKTYDIEYRPIGKLSRWSGSQAELIRAVEEQN